MALKVLLVYSNDDQFSLAVEFLRATVRERLPDDAVDHRVWHHAPYRDLANDYLAQYNAFLAHLFEFQPDVVAFSVYVWNQAEFARMSEVVRRFLPRCTIVWGGPQTASRRMAARLLERFPWLDIVVRGEAEDSYPILLGMLASDGDVAAVRGVTRRAPSGIHHAADAPAVTLSTIPVVFTAAGFPLEPVLRRGRPPRLAYETGRGCRQHCRFCLYGVPSLRVFRMERVEQELRYLLGGAVPFLRICDAHFGISRTRSMELFEIIAAHNRGTVVDIYPDTTHVDVDYVKAMNRAGCRVVSLGIQSSDPETLATSGRRFDARSFAQTVGVIRRHHNVRLAADVIIGLPGDSYERVKESVRFAYRSGIDRVHFAPLMAFPGVEFHERAEDFGIEHFDFEPPLVIQSQGFGIDDYRRSIVFATYVERLQRETPTVLKCLIATGADVGRFVEDVIAARPGDDTFGTNRRFAEIIAGVSGAAVAHVLADALLWDRMRTRQADRGIRLGPGRQHARVSAINGDAVARLHTRVDLILEGWHGPASDLPCGDFAYVFPIGGHTAYRLEGPLALAWATVEEGMSIDRWRNAGIDAVAHDEAMRILCLAGAVTLDDEAATPVTDSVPDLCVAQ